LRAAALHGLPSEGGAVVRTPTPRPTFERDPDSESEPSDDELEGPRSRLDSAQARVPQTRMPRPRAEPRCLPAPTGAGLSGGFAERLRTRARACPLASVPHAANVGETGDLRLDRGDEGFVLILLVGLAAQWRESLRDSSTGTAARGDRAASMLRVARRRAALGLGGAPLGVETSGQYVPELCLRIIDSGF
jgi:hypothetical protein